MNEAAPSSLLQWYFISCLLGNWNFESGVNIASSASTLCTSVEKWEQSSCYQSAPSRLRRGEGCIHWESAALVVRQLLVFEITWVSVHNTALFQVDIHDAWALLSLHCQTAFMSWDILQKHHHRKQVPSMQIGLTPHCVFSNFSKNSRSWGNDRVEGVISWSWGLFHFHTSKRSLFSAPQMNLVFTLWLFCM